MRWRPRVVYNAGSVTLDFELPQREWTPAPTTIGGSRRSASGAVAAYEVRHDELVEHTIRFSEDEWASVRTWLLWAQDGQPFDWYDEQTDVDTLDTVTLETPAKGQPIRPTRNAQFPLVYEMTITLRSEE